MTVYARGYRAYGGRLRAPPAAFAIAREASGRILKSRAFRRIGILYLLWFSVCTLLLYLSIGVGQDVFGGFGRGHGMAQLSVVNLNHALELFYVGLSYLTALLAVLVGSGLIADDLAAGALPLYLVRPLRAWDYVLGKALVLPLMLFGVVLLPGLFLYAITALWQEPGHSWAFLADHLDIAGRVVEYYLVTVAAYTGIVLFLSSRSPRRAAVAVMAAVLIFGGVLLQGIGLDNETDGVLGHAMRIAGLPRDTTAPFERASQAALGDIGIQLDRGGTDPSLLPSPSAVWILAAVLLAVGLVFAWRRARSVEITS